MPKIDKITVDNTEYDIVSGDNLPVGTEVEVEDGTTIPTGWEEVSNGGWKTLVTGATNVLVSLPSAFTELFIEIIVNNVEPFVPIFVPKIAIPATGTKTYRAGAYFMSNFNYGVSVNVGNDGIQFFDCLKESQVITSACRMNVYYK